MISYHLSASSSWLTIPMVIRAEVAKMQCSFPMASGCSPSAARTRERATSAYRHTFPERPLRHPENVIPNLIGNLDPLLTQLVSAEIPACAGMTRGAVIPNLVGNLHHPEDTVRLRRPCTDAPSPVPACPSAHPNARVPARPETRTPSPY